MMVKELEEVVVRFSGDSGDGMQLAGNIFSNMSATVGNDICTFPDYPADIRAPQGSLTGVSGFQVHIGAGQVYTPGDRCHVLVAMNPSALKTQIKFCKPQGLIITDSDSFEARDLEKAQFKTDNPFEELGVKQEVLEVPISSMCKESLKDSGLDNKSVLRCKNMFALGLVCWLFNRNLAAAEKMLREKFAKKPEIAEANIKVLNDGFNYGANTHASVSTYKIESKAPKSKGLYTDINGNKATSYGLIAAAEKAGLELYLGSYPITPATDILHELAKHKSLGVKTVQCEDEIAGCASAVGAAFAGALAVTTTSGPGVCLKSEAMNLAVIGELPLVIVNVQRGGPGLGSIQPAQSDYNQATHAMGHGDFHILVYAPCSVQEMVDTVTLAFDKADQYRMPAMILADGLLGQMMEPVTFPEPRTTLPDKSDWAANGHGNKREHHIINSLYLDAPLLEAKVQERFKRYAIIEETETDAELYCCDDAEIVVTAYGASARVSKSAVTAARRKGIKAGLCRPKTLWPFPKKELCEATKHASHILDVEMSMGQMIDDVRLATECRLPVSFFGRTGGVIPTPAEVLAEIEKLAGGAE